MGISKDHLYNATQLELAEIAKVLGHPARIAILQRLLAARACINSHLVLEIGLSQATISQHLQVLKSIGLIQGTVEGTAVSYCIAPDRWAGVRALLGDFLDQDASPDDAACC